MLIVARLDIPSLQVMREIRQRERQDAQRASTIYHSLHNLYTELRRENKLDLVTSHPEIAAQLFYHFDDRI